MRSLPIAVVLLAALLGAGAVRAGEPGCDPLTEIAAPDAHPGALPRVAAALQSGRLDILAVGSGTALGPRGRPEGSFADQMRQALKRAVPRAEVRLVLQGDRGMTAPAMVAALRRELATRPAALVLWQTGTVEAVRKTPPEDLARQIDAGAALVRQAGGDLVLVDPQYSRMLLSHAAIPPYRQAMHDAAARDGALLFSRFDLIRAWGERGEIDLESAAPTERAQTMERLNACLGQALAQAVLRGAGLAAAP